MPLDTELKGSKIAQETNSAILTYPDSLLHLYFYLICFDFLEFYFHMFLMIFKDFHRAATSHKANPGWVRVPWRFLWYYFIWFLIILRIHGSLMAIYLLASRIAATVPLAMSHLGHIIRFFCWNACWNESTSIVVAHTWTGQSLKPVLKFEINFDPCNTPQMAANFWLQLWRGKLWGALLGAM